MSSLPTPFADGTIAVVPWHDRILDEIGLDPRCDYVERFWTATLGPSTLLLHRRLVTELEGAPDGCLVDLEEVSLSLGLGDSSARSAPLAKALLRMTRFHLADPRGEGVVAVRRRISPLTSKQVLHLHPTLRSEHQRWVVPPETAAAANDEGRSVA